MHAISGERTRQAAVAQAPREHVARREQRRLVGLFGTHEWDPNHDPKAERAREHRP